MPFGLRSVIKLFDILADLVLIAQNTGVTYLIHYLDDYLTMGLLTSATCQQNLDTFTSLCAGLGVPLASDKLKRTFHITVISRNYPRHRVDGNQTTIR